MRPTQPGFEVILFIQSTFGLLGFLLLIALL